MKNVPFIKFYNLKTLIRLCSIDILFLLKLHYLCSSKYAGILVFLRKRIYEAH